MSRYAKTLYYGPKSSTLSQLGFYDYRKGSSTSTVLQQSNKNIIVGSINYWQLSCEQLELENLKQFCERCDLIFLISDEMTTRMDCDYPWNKVKQLLDQYNTYYIMFSDHASYTADQRHYVMPWFVKQNLLLPSEDNINFAEKQYVFNCLLGANKPHRTEIYNGVRNNKRIYTTYFGHPEHKHTSDTHLESENAINHLYNQPVHVEKLNTYSAPGKATFPGGYHFSHIVPIGVYNQSHFDIVSETTLVHHENFVTEKTAKCLAMGRYFVHYSSPNTKTYLESYGFDFRDYGMTYDSIRDNEHRMSALLDKIDEICDTDPEQQYDLTKDNRVFNQRQYNMMHQRFWGGVEQFVTSAIRTK